MTVYVHAFSIDLYRNGNLVVIASQMQSIDEAISHVIQNRL